MIVTFYLSIHMTCNYLYCYFHIQSHYDCGTKLSYRPMASCMHIEHINNASHDLPKLFASHCQLYKYALNVPMTILCLPFVTS